MRFGRWSVRYKRKCRNEVGSHVEAFLKENDDVLDLVERRKMGDECICVEAVKIMKRGW